MSNIKNIITDNDAENCNDPTAWEYRKSQAIWDELRDELVNATDAEWEVIKKKQQARYEQEIKAHEQEMAEHQFVKQNLFFAKDIQKDDVGGGRLSIIKNPEAFHWSLDDLKLRLVHDIAMKSNVIKNITDQEIVIDYGTWYDSKPLTVKYYIIINKEPELYNLNNFGKLFWGLK